MDECIDSLRDTTIFSTLNDNSGYWQVEIDGVDRDKTGFPSHQGLSRYTVGLSKWIMHQGRSRRFRCPIDKSQVEVCLCLLRIYRMPDEHIDHVQPVFKVLHDKDVKLNLKKCKVFTNCIDYLRHVIRPGPLQISARRINKIPSLKYSTTMR